MDFGSWLMIIETIMAQRILRAEELAMAMEARCYRGDVGRTSPRSYRMGAQDRGLVAVAAACLVSGLCYRVWG